MKKPTGRIWINFQELRERLSFEDVLRHYKVEIRRKGSQHQGPCPLPGHTGDKAAASFSANVEQGIFRCFSCGASGNVLEFAALMSGVDASNGRELRTVAIELQQKFFPEGTSSKPQPKPLVEVPKKTSVKVNEPLDFELKGLEANHAYLLKRGFDAEVVSYFGVGFCSRGYFAERIVIPLHSHEGKLIGYAGRVIDDHAITTDNPRYLFPENRERNGVELVFQKGLLLYNAHRVEAPCGELIIVESFTAVWWLHQNGYPEVVATMGTECTPEQLELILKMVHPEGRVWILTDGNKPGERLAQRLLLGLCAHRFVHWMKLPDECQPTDLSEEQLDSLFALS